MVVAGTGTAGTIVGIGRKLKPLLPNVKVLCLKIVRIPGIFDIRLM